MLVTNADTERGKGLVVFPIPNGLRRRVRVGPVPVPVSPFRSPTEEPITGATLPPSFPPRRGQSVPVRSLRGCEGILRVCPGRDPEMETLRASVLPPAHESVTVQQLVQDAVEPLVLQGVGYRHVEDVVHPLVRQGEGREGLLPSIEPDFPSLRYLRLEGGPDVPTRPPDPRPPSRLRG